MEVLANIVFGFDQVTAQKAECNQIGDEASMEKFISDAAGRAAKGVIPMQDVVRISVEVAVGLRRSMSKNRVRQIADFVNGMLSPAYCCKKNYRPAATEIRFATTFAEKVGNYTEMMRRPEYAEHRREMMMHQIGITDQSPTGMLVTAGLSAQDTITTIGEEYALSGQDVMDLVTIVIALAIAASTPAEKLDFVLDGMIQGVVEKKLWPGMQ